ncbi:hypothetical protein DFP72DRAFT_249186 [Ephemerocybe angulata]|uniref:Uncharacterized protein n=1 Tax=Ephemerocybe angulata TaxID=980116 RepID=A0A8H6MAL9_9AGAR|nr:hypothetical protein DFP72DRAFT_249186 [Tulosesus angulatus]
MSTHVSSRHPIHKPPQLPQMRPLFSYPVHAPNMALTAVDTTTITSTPTGTKSVRSIGSRPLPRPPQAAEQRPHSQRTIPTIPPLVQQQSSSTTRTHRLASNDDAQTPRAPPSSFKPQQRSSNYFMQSTIIPLVTTLQDPGILHALLSNLEWADTYSLLTTSKRLYTFFDTLALRDVILVRYLPEYAQCLRNRDMQYFQDVPVTVLDLDLLLISQRVPLHSYPIHALKIQSAMLPTLEDDQVREKLAALTQAHSRFVLLLQSLVHSSMASMPQETEEGTSRPRFSPIQTLRELTFPAPLAYTEAPPPPPKVIIPSSGKVSKQHVRHRSAPSSTVGRNHVLPQPPWPSPLPPSPRPSADVASSMISGNTSVLKKGRRLSIFGSKKNLRLANLPPPPDEPRALRVYASSWRKTSYWGSYGDISDDLNFSGTLKKPRRLAQQSSRQLRSIDSSDSSSLSGHSPSPLSQSRSRNSIVMQPEARATSAHDLILATSRVRAPILRVFVPCTKLDLESDAVIKCEQQLVESGLWNHLSTGDIVCNLGFVPPLEDGGSSEGDEGEFIMMRPGASGLAGNGAGGGGAGGGQKWLLYNGHMLVPYTPPDLLPLSQPLNLPTPFYYAHIMPPFTNLSYIISQLPVCDDVPQLTLVHGSKKVRSPHSPNGYAMVKKYSWVARVVRMRNETDGEMGEGWFGEWILEGEGTPEGKQLLINALRGHNLGHREWELVREKSGGGKLWLRLLTIC